MHRASDKFNQNNFKYYCVLKKIVVLLKPKQRDMVTEENEKTIQTGEEPNQTPTPAIDPQEGQKPTPTPPAPPDEKKIRSALAGDQDFSLEGIDPENITPGDNTDIESPPAPTPEPTPEPLKQEPTASELKSQWLWDKVKEDYEKQFGEGSFQPPKELTPETEYETLLTFFQQTLEPDLSDIPQEAREIIELHREGKYDPEKFFEKRSPSNDIAKLPDKDFLFEIYRARNGKSEERPDGWTDDDIEEFLSRKTKIELHEMAQNGRNQITKIREEQKTQAQQRGAELANQQFEKMQEAEMTAAKKIVNQFKDNRDFFGIEFSPEEKTQFDRDFIEMVKFNPETKTQKLAEMLQDHNTLYKVAAILWKGENLRGYITKIKEAAKEDTERKLDPALDPIRGTTKLTKPVDRGKLV